MSVVESIEVDEAAVLNWLIVKFATRLGVGPGDVDIDMQFPDFKLDSVEALLLTGELEKWLSIDLSPTAMWYHPTLRQLAKFISEEYQESLLS